MGICFFIFPLIYFLNESFYITDKNDFIANEIKSKSFETFKRYTLLMRHKLKV